MLLLTALFMLQTAQPTTADVRCVAAVSMAMGSTDPSLQKMMSLASLYWMGRLGVIDEAQLEKQMADEAEHMTGAELSSELVRCGNEMQREGEKLQKVGNRLQERAKHSSSD
jgi:hypothetical protein